MIGWLFVLPALLMYATFVLLPLVLSILYSFFRWDGIGPMTWVGIKNYRTVLGVPDLLGTIFNAFRLVDHIFVMTRGGPDNATALLLFYIYEIGFRFWDSAYAATLTIVLLALLALVALAQFFFLERRVHYQ